MAGDLDGDGAGDVFVHGVGLREMVAWGDGAGGFTAAHTPDATGIHHEIDVVHLDHDGTAHLTPSNVVSLGSWSASDRLIGEFGRGGSEDVLVYRRSDGGPETLLLTEDAQDRATRRPTRRGCLTCRPRSATLRLLQVSRRMDGPSGE